MVPKAYMSQRSFLLLESSVLVNTSVLAFGKRIQARCKNVVKIIVKFVRMKVEKKGGKEGETFSAPRARNGRKHSKWWAPCLSLVLSDLEKYV
jgi:hypothetical protein